MIGQNKIFKKYQKIRKNGMELNRKYLECCSDQDIRIAGRILGLLKGKKIVLSSKADMDRYYDFMVNDYKNFEGKNLIQIYKEKHIDISKEDVSIMDASLSSRSSLYEIVSSNAKYKTLELKDLLNSEAKNIDIIDVGFSSNPLINNFVIYTRVITFPDFNMTSGAPLLFDGDYRDTIIDKYNKKAMKIVVGDETTKRAAAFFQLYQKYGYKSVGHLDLT